MSRLHRGLWQVKARFPDRFAIEPVFPVVYEDASVLAAMLGEEGARRAILIRLPGSRAAWEYKAPFEATNPPKWEEGVDD